MEPCKYFYETDGLIVRIVDTWKNLEESIQTCKQFGEQLAPINNWKRINDTLIQLSNCERKDIYDLSTSDAEYRNFYLYRTDFSNHNETHNLTDVDKSLFSDNYIPVGNETNFWIRKKNFKGLLTFGDDFNHWKNPFLCSKNKLDISTTEVTANDVDFEANSVPETNFFMNDLNSKPIFSVMFGISLVLNLLLIVVIAFLIYKLVFQKKEIVVEKTNINTSEVVRKFLDENYEIYEEDDYSLPIDYILPTRKVNTNLKIDESNNHNSNQDNKHFSKKVT